MRSVFTIRSHAAPIVVGMSEYVTNESWVRSPGRLDAIDDVADQYERPEPSPVTPDR